jgi:hypothetical protein
MNGPGARRADFTYLATGLRVARELLGTSIAAEVNGTPFRVTFPHLPPPRFGHDTFDLDGDDLGDLVVDTDPSLPWVEIDCVKISVPTAAPLRWSDFPPVWADHPVLEEHAVLLRAIRPIADSIARRVIETLKVTSDQPWVLSQFAEPPLMFARLVDEAANHRLPGGISENFTPVHKRPAFVTKQHWLQMPDLMSAPLPDARLLLVEAERQLLFAAPRSPRLATVLAAMACELRTPAALQDLTPADRLPLLKEALRRPQSQARLYGDVMKAACGISLVEDDRALFDAVAALIDLRNRIVHTGAESTGAEAQRSVESAHRLFAWFDARLQS